jgi:hypothetical protein
MKPDDLILRCYAEQENDVWIAVCLDFCLATQGDSLVEVKTKLESQIADYVYDALVGDDKEFAHQLLTRKAPLQFWARYYWLKLKTSLFHTTGAFFDEVMPLKPA